MTINICPINDIKPHTFNSTCECNPDVIIENGEMLIVHNSFDGRELVEEAENIINGNTCK
jgi:uncharacterized protein YlzI (FlbEa/FlbD family)